eukprot:222349_1
MIGIVASIYPIQIAILVACCLSLSLSLFKLCKEYCIASSDNNSLSCPCTLSIANENEQSTNTALSIQQYYLYTQIEISNQMSFVWLHIDHEFVHFLDQTPI